MSNMHILDICNISRQSSNGRVSRYTDCGTENLINIDMLFPYTHKKKSVDQGIERDCWSGS